MAESVLAKEQCCQELVERTAVLAERTLTNEHRCREEAECSATLGVTALAKVQRLSLSAEMAFAEFDAQTIASWDAAMVEAAEHATTLAVMALTELKATPKLRYGGPPPTHFSPPLTAKEVTKLDAATLNKQCCRKMAEREKALADEAYKQCWVATQEKELADEVNKQCCQVTAARENALANDAFEGHYQELSKRAAASTELALAAEQAAVSTDLALPPTAMSPPPHHPNTYKDAVLCTMGGILCAKSLVVAPLSCPSTTVNGQLQTACCRSQPHRRVGSHHGLQAHNPQEHLLCGWRHWPRTPNQSTVNGWA
jgi:hypothetical protein